VGIIPAAYNATATYAKVKVSFMHWQREQIVALAPDQASIKAAQGLTLPQKWPLLGCTADALWGECQGSGKSPYQTAIDLDGPAFHCSCPSRKFPCKHGLALFLLYHQSSDLFRAHPLPNWAQQWLDGRAKRKQAATTPSSALPMVDQSTEMQRSAATTADSKAVARRAAARAEKVAKGIDELTIWLKDLVRGGFVEAQRRPYAYWQEMAARLVDAQAPALATQVQALSGIALSGTGWAEHLTVAVGRLALLIEAYQRLEALPLPLQEDVRSLIGWHQSKEELLAGQPVHGIWRVLSHTVEPEEPLLAQRVWLQERTSGAYALILNFAHPSQRQSLDTFWRVGVEVAATLYYYTAAVPLRVLATEVTAASAITEVAAGASVADALQQYQTALAQNPWLTRYPLWLADVVVGLAQREGTQLFVYDKERHLLPISRKAKSGWQLLSLTGGNPVHLFGEWLDDGLIPLGLWQEGRYWAL